MELSKIISLIIAILYLVCIIAATVYEAKDEQISAPEVFENFFGLFLWLAISLGCIWWGDELGEGLVGAKYGLISEPSAGWGVRMMGWVLLLLPLALILFYLFKGDIFE